MSRLIDADALADALFEKGKNYPQWVADVIGSMPEAVARCKDCKHYRPGRLISCEMLNLARDGNWFCADGEKRITQSNFAPDCTR